MWKYINQKAVRKPGLLCNIFHSVVGQEDFLSNEFLTLLQKLEIMSPRVLEMLAAAFAQELWKTRWLNSVIGFSWSVLYVLGILNTSF